MEVDMAVVPNDPQPQQQGNDEMQENSQDTLGPLPTPGKPSLSTVQAVVQQRVVRAWSDPRCQSGSTRKP